MDRFGKAVILIFIAIAIDRLCTLVPSEPQFDPFPFYDIVYCYPGVECENVGINLQYYVKCITNHGGLILIMLAFRILSPPNFYRLFTVFMVIECLSLADFLLIYEQSFANIGKYPVEFTDFKILGYALSIIAWKMQKL